MGKLLGLIFDLLCIGVILFFICFLVFDAGCVKKPIPVKQPVLKSKCCVCMTC